MKIGDLVTVQPYGKDVYLIVDFLRKADTNEAQQHLGSLWQLYSEDMGMSKMHEKWMIKINA
jgi:hypothetical protein